jgi:hypothetical protein
MEDELLLDALGHTKPHDVQAQQPPAASGLPDLYATIESLLIRIFGAVTLNIIS